MRKIVATLILIVFGTTFVFASGVTANKAIAVPSTNAFLEFAASSAGGTESKIASEDANIADHSFVVKEINGLFNEGVNDDEITGNYLDGVYTQITPGNGYEVLFTYRNRGNTDEDVVMSVSDEQAVARWGVSGNITKTIAEDQLVAYSLLITPDITTLSFERVTIDVNVDLAAAFNVVSYNVFPDVVSSDMLNSAYGGIDNFVYRFVLEAEGYDLTIFSRAYAWSTPNAYNGLALSGDNLPPGTMVSFNIVIENNGNAIAQDIVLTDKIPANCHLYYVLPNTPNVLGANAWEWQGAGSSEADSTYEANNGGAPAVKFIMDIPAGGRVTASYAVTID